jgi:hypothetical protein
LNVVLFTATSPPNDPANATLEAVNATSSPDVLMAREVRINVLEEDRTVEQDAGAKEPVHDAIEASV